MNTAEFLRMAEDKIAKHERANSVLRDFTGFDSINELIEINQKEIDFFIFCYSCYTKTWRRALRKLSKSG